MGISDIDINQPCSRGAARYVERKLIQIPSRHQIVLSDLKIYRERVIHHQKVKSNQKEIYRRPKNHFDELY